MIGLNHKNTICKKIGGLLYEFVYDTDRNPWWAYKGRRGLPISQDNLDLFYIELAYKQGGVAKNEHTYQGEGEQFSSHQKQTT
jgi:hypothetical protein